MARKRTGDLPADPATRLRSPRAAGFPRVPHCAGGRQSSGICFRQHLSAPSLRYGSSAPFADLQRLVELALPGVDMTFAAQHAFRQISRTRLSRADGGLIAHIVRALLLRWRRRAGLRERLAEHAVERNSDHRDYCDRPHEVCSDYLPKTTSTAFMTISSWCEMQKSFTFSVFGFSSVGLITVTSRLPLKYPLSQRDSDLVGTTSPIKNCLHVILATSSVICASADADRAADSEPIKRSRPFIRTFPRNHLPG